MIHRVPDLLMLNIRFRVMPSFLSQSIGTLFWDAVVEALRESEGRLLALPPSQGQTQSNQELFDSILKDAQCAVAHDSPTPIVDSDDGGSNTSDSF